MNKAVIVIRVMGLSNTIKIFDTVIKNAYVSIVKILPELGGGVLNVFLKGSVGQINEAEFLVREICASRNIEYQISVIPNFDFDIIELDDKEISFQKNKL
jgi:microcompartment protein CcmL/EutN